MDTTSIQQPSATGPKTSRLPAGSTLTLPNGITIPHPHAEANLPGAGDSRSAGTSALDESLTGQQQPLPNPVTLTESQAAANLNGTQPAKTSGQ